VTSRSDLCGKKKILQGANSESLCIIMVSVVGSEPRGTLDVIMFFEHVATNQPNKDRYGNNTEPGRRSTHFRGRATPQRSMFGSFVQASCTTCLYGTLSWS
jgi:hypothetical protein